MTTTELRNKIAYFVWLFSEGVSYGEVTKRVIRTRVEPVTDKSGFVWSTTPGRPKVMIRFGRYVRKHLGLGPDVIKDHKIDEVAGEIWADESNYEFTLVSGRALLDAYLDGVGGHTCMTGDKAVNMKLLASYPEKVRLLILSNERSGFTARALVWTTDDGETVMDRIYPNGGWHARPMQEYGEKRGWWVRCTNGAADPIRFYKNDKVRKDFRVTLANGGSAVRFPYLDSFCYAHQNGNDLVLATAPNDNTKWLLQSQYGGYSLYYIDGGEHEEAQEEEAVAVQQDGESVADNPAF